MILPEAINYSIISVLKCLSFEYEQSDEETEEVFIYNCMFLKICQVGIWNILGNCYKCWRW